MSREKITLKVKEGLWVAVITGERERQIRELFGSNVIPTPFRADTGAARVAQEVRRRNPDADVSLACGDNGVGWTRVVRKSSTGEWIVRAYDCRGKRIPQADYYTDDKADAEETAKAMMGVQS